MEVVDSHMSEQFSAHTPAHIDVDMSAEYDDDAEYAMHDVTEATTTTNDTNDEEIYDAEFEEVPQHTEIEMDEYADEVEAAEEDETHMGAYVPTDDAATVTDVTVEDVQLRSSPVPQGTTIGSISPHVSVDAELPLSEAPVGALADHSPHSVTTLVGDSEIEHLPADTTKEDHLNEVIDLTENNEVSQIVLVDDVDEDPSVNPADSTDQTLLQSHRDATEDDLDGTEQEFYDVEESVAEVHSTDPNIPDQLVEQQEPEQQGEEQHPEHTDQDKRPAETSVYLEIPEQTDQGGHSPIEEALVINQQVRDDAADSMEPSPPVRLYYRDEGKGTDEVFDIFTSTGLESDETILLFHDNRTLFYEPLSTFFARLRETKYFSGDGWVNSEMGLRMDLGNSSVSINEDHKETDNISLFKLSFMWSGFGLEEPLELTLVRLSERLVVQLTRLIESIEQRDSHNEDATERPEGQHEAEIGGPEINAGGVDDENDDSEAAFLENNNQPGAPIDPNVIPDGISRGTHESEDKKPLDAAQPDGLDEQHQGGDGDDETETTQGVGADRSLEERTQDNPTQDRDPTTHVDYQGTETEGIVSSTQNNDDNTVNHGQSPSSSTPKPQGDEYDEYEEGESNPAPAQTSVPDGGSGEGWDANEYDYEEDYEGANSDEGHSKRTPPGSVPDEPTDSDRVSLDLSAPKSQGPEPLQNSGLKRNLDELEYEEYETPSAPSSPGSEYKRLKHT